MQSSPSKHNLSCKCQIRKNLNVNNKCGKRQKFHQYYIRGRDRGNLENAGFISQINKLKEIPHFDRTSLMLISCIPSSSHSFLLQAAWGGGLLLSRKYRHPKLTGIERWVLNWILKFTLIYTSKSHDKRRIYKFVKNLLIELFPNLSLHFEYFVIKFLRKFFLVFIIRILRFIMLFEIPFTSATKLEYIISAHTFDIGEMQSTYFIVYWGLVGLSCNGLWKRSLQHIRCTSHMWDKIDTFLSRWLWFERRALQMILHENSRRQSARNVSLA